MGYATTDDVQARMSTTMSATELEVCESLLDDAATIIDTFAPDADADAKQYVSIRMVIRSLDTSSDGGFPIGTTQGSQSALGYSASFTLSSGSGYGEFKAGSAPGNRFCTQGGAPLVEGQAFCVKCGAKI